MTQRRHAPILRNGIPSGCAIVVAPPTKRASLWDAWKDIDAFSGRMTGGDQDHIDDYTPKPWHSAGMPRGRTDYGLLPSPAMPGLASYTPDTNTHPTGMPA
ncbi:hypothetical protein GCM10028786_22550 [Flaviaesturariibacter terrae]